MSVIDELLRRENPFLLSYAHLDSYCYLILQSSYYRKVKVHLFFFALLEF